MSIRRNAVAYVALFIALGGTAYAAKELPRNSVGSSQLRNGSVTNVKVRPHSLTSGVFVPGTLPSGGVHALNTTVVTTPATPPSCGFNTTCPTVPGGTTNTETATCPSGTELMSGGYTLGPPQTPVGAETVVSNQPLSPTTWQVTFALSQTGPFPVGSVYAICAALS